MNLKTIKGYRNTAEAADYADAIVYRANGAQKLAYTPVATKPATPAAKI